MVATPIGNLEDMTFRAVKVLQEVDLIACEDTRHTRKLLNHFNITTPLISYYREKEQEKASFLLEILLSGKNIALVSDAGTPAVSDPGAVLVKKVREADIKVTPVPGASALVAALSIAGLSGSEFYFAGFLPHKSNLRKKVLQDMLSFSCPLLFYESPHRIKQSIDDCLEVLGDRQAVLFRELTKMYEEVREGNLSFLLQVCQGKNRGEMVLLIKPDLVVSKEKPEELDEIILWYKDEKKESLKGAVKAISNDLGLPRNKVYQRALLLYGKG